MDDFYIKQQTTVDIPEHQILISFNNDEDAEKFDYWFGTIGKNMFLKYLDTDE